MLIGSIGPAETVVGVGMLAGAIAVPYAIWRFLAKRKARIWSEEMRAHGRR